MSSNTFLISRLSVVSAYPSTRYFTRVLGTEAFTPYIDIGISGGLDSTLALLVTVKAYDMLGIDRSGITAITMPGFGTTKRTRSNATCLMELLGVTMLEIPIGEAVIQHFNAIGHDPELHDATYENSCTNV